MQPRLLPLDFPALFLCCPPAVKMLGQRGDFSWWMWAVLQRERVKLKLVFM